VKTVAGITAIVAAVFVAAIATTISILWWSTADIIKQMRGLNRA
jgi:hypothetical protein